MMFAASLNVLVIVLFLSICLQLVAFRSSSLDSHILPFSSSQLSSKSQLRFSTERNYGFHRIPKSSRLFSIEKKKSFDQTNSPSHNSKNETIREIFSDALVGIKSHIISLKNSSTIILHDLYNKTQSSKLSFDPKNPKKDFLLMIKELYQKSPMIFRFTLYLLALYVMYSLFSSSQEDKLKVSYSDFLNLLDKYPAKIKGLMVNPNELHYRVGSKMYITNIPMVPPFILDTLVKSGVSFYAINEKSISLSSLLISWLPYLPLLFIVRKIMKFSGDNDIIGKKRNDLPPEIISNLSFNDVAGLDHAKVDIQEICEMLSNPQKYKEIGARLPSGVLLVGPPGTGKTLLARITAAESKVPFYSCSASDFDEMFIGRGSARVRDLFKVAAKQAPCIIFIDEIDSLGRARKLASLNTETEKTLNQLLTCMDGLDTSNNGVIVIAATNRYELLDEALLRAGRFDRIIQCQLPDKNGRMEILKVHTRKINLKSDIDLERLAKLTPGMSGADLGGLVNEAAIRTVRRNGSQVNFHDFENALMAFYQTRNPSINSLAELASYGLNMLPSWLGTLVAAKLPSSSNSTNNSD